jgi:hypothetical protein
MTRKTGRGSRPVRFGVGAAAGAVALLLCTGPASASHTDAGAYYGDLPGGGTIELFVSSDGSELDAVTGRNVPSFPQPACSPFIEGTRNDEPITNHAYSTTNNPGTSSSGTFAPYGAVSGTYSIQSGGCSTGTQSFTARFPVDTLIGRTPDITLIGDDVHSRNGANQTRKWNARRGQTRSFDVQVRNDGPVTDNAFVDGCSSPNGFKVKYFDGATDVTTDVEAGTYSFNLDPDVGRTLQMELKAKASAPIGKSRSCAVAGAFEDMEDVVKAKVKVKRG